VKQEKKDVETPEAAIMRQLGAPKAAPKEQVEQIPVLKWKGVEYLLRAKKGSGGLSFDMFRREDDAYRTVIGEIAINPATGTFKGSAPVFKA